MDDDELLEFFKPLVLTCARHTSNLLVDVGAKAEHRYLKVALGTYSEIFASFDRVTPDITSLLRAYGKEFDFKSQSTYPKGDAVTYFLHWLQDNYGTRLVLSSFRAMLGAVKITSWLRHWNYGGTETSSLSSSSNEAVKKITDGAASSTTTVRHLYGDIESVELRREKASPSSRRTMTRALLFVRWDSQIYDESDEHAREWIEVLPKKYGSPLKDGWEIADARESEYDHNVMSESEDQSRLSSENEEAAESEEAVSGSELSSDFDDDE